MHEVKAAASMIDPIRRSFWYLLFPVLRKRINHGVLRLRIFHGGRIRIDFVPIILQIYMHIDTNIILRHKPDVSKHGVCKHI